MTYKYKKRKGLTSLELISMLVIITLVVALAIPVVSKQIDKSEANKRDNIAQSLTKETKLALDDFDGRLNTPTSVFSDGSFVHSNIAENCNLDNHKNSLIIGAYDYDNRPDIETVESLVTPQEFETAWVVLVPNHSYNSTLPDIDMVSAKEVNIDFTYPVIVFVIGQDFETQVYLDGINYTDSY